MGDYKIGQTVQFGEERQGIIRWLGRGAFATGEWVGIELPDDSGKNDGSVKGERYFECAPGHGMMIRPEAIIAILKQPPLATKAKPANGATNKPRPSSGFTADVARKRQSLMSTGSTTGSRLSLRVSNSFEDILYLTGAPVVPCKVPYESSSLFYELERIHAKDRNSRDDGTNLRLQQQVSIKYERTTIDGSANNHKARYPSIS